LAWEEVAAHLGFAALILAERRRPYDCPYVAECDRAREVPGADT
jgi:hypothetical protein